MNRSLKYRALVTVVILALIAVATAATAHGHLGTNASADESHCPLCMAVHAAKHALFAPLIEPRLAVVQTTVFISPTNLVIILVCPLLTEGRAPPSL